MGQGPHTLPGCVEVSNQLDRGCTPDEASASTGGCSGSANEVITFGHKFTQCNKNEG